MSKGVVIFFGFMFMLTGMLLLVISHVQREHETRITSLEQSQCVAKESKVHADVKFEACMSQLRGKTP